MIVLDASATAFALLDEGETGAYWCRAALRADSQWLVPEPWLVEVLSVIRGNPSGGKHNPRSRCGRRRGSGQRWSPLSCAPGCSPDRIWQLRNNLSTYDAAYVAAAEQYQCARVTTDMRLARASGVRCAVSVIS